MKIEGCHYEDHMAELCATGADVGDFIHSRKMFVPMIKAIDAYIDNRVSTFLTRTTRQHRATPSLLCHCRQIDESPNNEPSNSNLSSGKWRKTSHFFRCPTCLRGLVLDQ